MLTASQLASLEKLAHESGLRGEALTKAFASQLSAGPAPLCSAHNKLRSYLEWLYDQLHGSREKRLSGYVRPTFNEWVGKATLADLKRYD